MEHRHSCFLFKPDGIGDFFLSSGVVRLLGREFGEENLTIAVLPVMESVGTVSKGCHREAAA